jgi:hypothetical protein
MRYVNDIFLLHAVCCDFLPKRVLEIGFLEGQTLSTLINACSPDTQFVSVDINFCWQENFQSLWSDSEPQITWICADSASVTYDGLFDLAMIDGDHSYTAASQDLEKVLAVSHPNTIVIMDDYALETEDDRGVKGVIQDHLLGQRDWVPFLMGDQTMFFHHVSHDCADFLDNRIQKFAKNFIYFENVQYNNYCVLRSRTPNIFKDHIDLFCLALEKYNI